MNLTDREKEIVLKQREQDQTWNAAIDQAVLTLSQSQLHTTDSPTYSEAISQVIRLRR